MPKLNPYQQGNKFIQCLSTLCKKHAISVAEMDFWILGKNPIQFRIIGSIPNIIALGELKKNNRKILKDRNCRLQNHWFQNIVKINNSSK